MSFVKTVLVSNDAGAAATTVEPGKLVLFVNDTATASGSWAAAVAGTKYQLMTGNGKSIRFDGADIVKASNKAYTAGTSQVLQVTPVIESDGSAFIKLIDVTDGREKFAIATFEAVGAANNAAAVDQLVDAINASKRDVFKDVQAAENGSDATKIDITIPKGYIFRGASNDASSAVTQSTAPVLPFGTPALVAADVDAALPFEGVTNLAGQNVVKPASTATGTYQAFVVELNKTVGDREDVHEITVYIPSANTTLNGQFDTLLGL